MSSAGRTETMFTIGDDVTKSSRNKIFMICLYNRCILQSFDDAKTALIMSTSTYKQCQRQCT